MSAADEPRVFVSHANADKAFVSKFVNSVLIRGAGLRPHDIFYSSASDTGVGSGEYLMERVRSEAGSSQLVIALITPTYQTRPVCVAELGAAWAREVLFPVMAPEMTRSELEGVLPGLSIKAVDDDDVLDEIADHMRSLDFDVSARSYGVGKADWKSELRAGTRPAKLAPTPTSEQVQKLEGELKNTQEALDQLKGELKDQVRRNDKLREAKSVAEVREADLPSDENDRFDALRTRAHRALGNVSDAVSDAVFHQTSGQPMILPSRMDEPTRHDAIQDEITYGLLTFDEDTGEVFLNEGFPKVESARLAASELSDFLKSTMRSEAFELWFKAEFETPADLRLKGCWDAVL